VTHLALANPQLLVKYWKPMGIIPWNFQSRARMERKPPKSIQKITAKPLSDAAMKKIMPIFVDESQPDDHKCKNCSMRIEGGGDKAECTVVDGDVSLSKGVCTFWAGVKAASSSDTHASLMSKSTAGYIEVPAELKIQCGTCKHFSKNYCSLWAGKVEAGQCCMAWENSQERPGK
jgi:hypothetical protein